MISLALEECTWIGIHGVLMVCDKENIASAKTIMNNNGILENEVAVDGVVEQRYWIEFYGKSRRSWVRLAGVLL